MTVEELRREAKAMGYNIVRVNPKEKLLPCVCGSKRRGHWSWFNHGVEYTVLKCEKCEREAYGRTDREARHNWNEMIKGEIENNHTEGVDMRGDEKS